MSKTHGSRKPNLSAAVVAGAGLLVLVGCTSSMVPKTTQDLDSQITKSVEQALESNEKVKARQVDVVTREGLVYLVGVVDTAEARREAGRVAWGVQGVSGVDNEITVGEMTVGDWADDIMISSKVKAQLISNTLIKAGDIDVSSSQGVVTLIGRVSTQSIKTDAERVARNTKGVTSVNNELLVGKAER
ncbi:MAG TPA: BON domain-containing protein [Thermoanaerobaculia bacterium]|nr:BON domain-containing protein [Thermoanaerobaculia bacterium]